MQKNQFPKQTHFVGVLVPDDLTLTLEDCRRYMNETYGCKSGYGTPVHVTLVPPFHLDDKFSTRDIARSIQQEMSSLSGGIRKFNARIENFDAFGDRTIFAKVLDDKKWINLRNLVFQAVLKIAPNSLKKDSRPFVPHLTVANRDIPQGSSVAALKVLNELELQEDFPVDNVTIFERRQSRWISTCSIEL